MTIPPDKPGVSHRRLAALEEKRRKIDLARCSDKVRKDYELRLAAAGLMEEGQLEAGARPKRKRARYAARAQIRAKQDIEAPFTDETIRVYKDAIARYVVPRMMAQEARREGDPHARPRDFIID